MTAVIAKFINTREIIANPSVAQFRCAFCIARITVRGELHQINCYFELRTVQNRRKYKGTLKILHSYKPYVSIL